ncbi:unnamed protein product [Rotaria magnacalcarata]|uniref:G domain-containing protein n=1 Tax=Rotaria magnacalcarata TaxID=392030 RepID=A0A819E7C9_9BILA|nr:unnamed protein product [Rotaria magnacalcarata]CAF3747093.1 unnamed protein product [Rotaria magnacalcarata]CAF3845801.1 unnamed protein product [Rotaria magnacalcarata]
MESAICSIQVHVRRTGEMVTVNVEPSKTTYEEILREICRRINEREPSHYYLALNYEVQLENDDMFQLEQENNRFQLIMRARWLLEYLTEKEHLRNLQIQKKMTMNASPSTLSHVIANSNDDANNISIVNERPDHSVANSNSTVSSPDNENNQSISRDVVHAAVQQIPRQGIQNYLHQVVGKTYDIMLMGLSEVGKSTLINPILKKEVTRTHAERNSCTQESSSYEYLCRAEELKGIVDACKNLKVFIAMVVTNMYASDEADVVLEIFPDTLTHDRVPAKVENNIHYYGDIGLCTQVNSIDYVINDIIKKNERCRRVNAGHYEFIE